MVLQSRGQLGLTWTSEQFRHEQDRATGGRRVYLTASLGTVYASVCPTCFAYVVHGMERHHTAAHGEDQ